MVGGYIIDIFPIGEVFTRLWVMDPSTCDEMCVVVETQEDMPMLRDNIWWQGRKVFFDNDNKFLVKVGNSYVP